MQNRKLEQMQRVVGATRGKYLLILRRNDQKWHRNNANAGVGHPRSPCAWMPDAEIDREERRGEKPSDHARVITIFKD